MWLLTEERVTATPADAELQTYTFCAGADGSPSIAGVGRKPRDPAPSAGNIILENQSISRVHAEVHCCAQQKDEAQQKLQVVDKSKFGSFVNGVKIGKGQTVQLKDGDVVLFGTVAKAATFRADALRAFCFARWRAWQAAVRGALDRRGARREAMAALGHQRRVARKCLAAWRRQANATRARAVAVRAQHRHLAERRAWKVWERRWAQAAVGTHKAMVAAAEKGAVATKRRVLRTWRDAVAGGKLEARLERDREEKWSKVRGWLKPQGGGLPL